MHKYKTHVTYNNVGARQKPEQILGGLLEGLLAGKPGPVLIAIGGPGGTGKSTFAEKLQKLLGDSAILRLDDYKTSREVRKSQGLYGAHPGANKMELVAEHLGMTKGNVGFDKPVYDSVTGDASTTERYKPAKFNIIDGEISTYKKFRDIIDFSVFIDSDWKTQLATRTSRDVMDRGYTKEKAIATFLQSNLREFSKFGAESKNWADVHIYCKEDYSLMIESVAHELYDHFENILAKYLKPVDLSGLIVPVTTPFTKSNVIDQEKFIEHLNFLADSGVKRILVNGTTAEFSAMTQDERKLATKLATEYFPGVIIVHIGCGGLAETVGQGQFAQEYGADAVMAIAPYYFANAPEAGIVEYFNRLGGQLEVPLMLYNFPKHTQNAITAEMLAEIEHFAIKDSSGDLSLIGAAKRYFVGGDEKILAGYRQGAVGFVSARANYVPEMFVELEEAWVNGDAAVEEIQAKITEFKGRMTSENGIAKIKQAVGERVAGYPVGVRLPLVGLGADEVLEIKKLMADNKN